MQITNTKQRGFTIIELIVVMAIFMFIIGAAISIFLSIVNMQRKVLSDQQLLNQIGYVEEYMSKALRMAGVETSSGTCLVDSNNKPYSGAIYELTDWDAGLGQYKGIKFINLNGDSNGNPICQKFFLDNLTHVSGNLVLNIPDNPIVLKDLQNSTDITKAFPLTSVKINSMKIYVPPNICTGQDPCVAASNTSGSQPRITIVLNVKNSAGGNMIFQITVSGRNLNSAS